MQKFSDNQPKIAAPNLRGIGETGNVEDFLVDNGAENIRYLFKEKSS